MRLTRAVLPAVLFLLLSWPASTPASPATPSCATGPITIGDTTLGTPCNDVIHASPGVATVRGGGGDDTIAAAPIAAAASCPEECRLGVGSQTFDGGPGDDVVYGERGNDKLNGGEGNDRLYGGIGDDLLRGGRGDDRLSGGFGFDRIDGEAGNDYVRGDGTIDEIVDSGGGTDTLSYATGVTPGFTRSPGTIPGGFPSSSGERGIYVDLEAGIGDNGIAPAGGGADEIEVEAGSFERVIGTPFSDYIAGSGVAETIYGGGGADAILGRGGDDTLRGGADGDYLDGGGDEDNLDAGPGDDGDEIALRDPTKVSVGFEAPAEPGLAQLYLVGGNAGDDVTATYSAGSPAGVSFELAAGAFDTSPSASSGCGTPTATKLVCTLAAPLDSLLLAGMDGNDVLRVVGFPGAASIVLLGGAGVDSLTGGDASEDVLVDGPGSSGDTLTALGGDDALLRNGGADTRLGGNGNDLFLSNSLCDGDLLDGGSGRDNSSWSKLGEPVEARLGTGFAGRPGGGAPSCSGGSPDHLQAIEDLEGTNQGDFFYGDSGKNQLLGRPGGDTYFALDGDDSILANSGDADLVVDCGNGLDSALIDRPPIADPAPVGCESVNQADPESFEPPPLLPEAHAPSPSATSSPTARDRRAPGTRITRRPPRVVTTSKPRRKVVFAFAASEPGVSFRCKLDRRPFSPCRSPRAYRVRWGAHTIRIYAIDAAGNRDRSPVRFKFRVRRL